MAALTVAMQLMKCCYLIWDQVNQPRVETEFLQLLYHKTEGKVGSVIDINATVQNKYISHICMYT